MPDIVVAYKLKSGRLYLVGRLKSIVMENNGEEKVKE